MTHLEKPGNEFGGTSKHADDAEVSGRITVDGVQYLSSDATVPCANPGATPGSVDTRTRDELRNENLRRYAHLKQPLPADLPDDGDRLQTRLEKRSTRCCVVEIGPAVNGGMNSGGQLFDGNPWVFVWFDQPDTEGSVEEMLPINALEFLDEWATSVPGTSGATGQHFSGQMPEMPTLPPFDEHHSIDRRSVNSPASEAL